MEVRIVTHSGEDEILEVIDFDSTAFTDKLNDDSINAVELGGSVFARIDIKLVQPVKI